MSAAAQEGDSTDPSHEKSAGPPSEKAPLTFTPKTARNPNRAPPVLRPEPPWKLPGQPGAFGLTEPTELSLRMLGTNPLYSSYFAKDPFRYGLQFPAVMNELGSLKKRILDVGTGDGLFPRLMARKGARVVGYDKAAEKITDAKAHKDGQERRVQYVVAAPQTFTNRGMFDAATSIMVLPCAYDFEELRAFFRNTSTHLGDNGKFVSVVLNPSFAAFDENLIVRRVRKLDGNRVQMEFLNELSGAVEMNPIMHQYTQDEYEAAATQNGMMFEWKKLFAAPEAVARKGEAFWRRCHETQPYALLIAQKR
jgi:2-polyprenyl-3-methyl-5-hydroxy-6-metoxy-1,4-benzoquinol methylase